MHSHELIIDQMKTNIRNLLLSAWKTATEKKNIHAVCSFIKMTFQPVMLKSTFLSEGENSPLKKVFISNCS